MYIHVTKDKIFQPKTYIMKGEKKNSHFIEGKLGRHYLNQVIKTNILGNKVH